MEKPTINLDLLDEMELDLYHKLCPNEKAKFSDYYSELKQHHLNSHLSNIGDLIESDSCLNDWYDYFINGVDSDEAFNNYYFED